MIAQYPSGNDIFNTSNSYRICTRCIMDTSDAEIIFDEDGVCNHCIKYDRVISDLVYTGDDGRERLKKIIHKIKLESINKRYDCIIGLSGGVDSTYVAYLVKKKYGLRPLAVHVDNGWNSEIAVGNIERIVKKLDIDLYTEVINWDEFRRLQLAFLRSSTPDAEIPTDHAIVATMYRQAIKNGVRFIIGGSNYVTEQMIPRTWSHGHDDWKYIRTVNKRFGGMRLKTYPHYTFFEKTFYFPRHKKLEVVNILNYLDFDKFKAIELMKSELGWVSYGGKHHESIYTKFYQCYILPNKFGADKRRSHLSCLVNSKKLTREEALSEIQKPSLDKETLERDRVFVIKKLGITEAEFDTIIAYEPKTTWDYPCDEISPPFYANLFRKYVNFSANKIYYIKMASSISLIGFAKSFARRLLKR